MGARRLSVWVALAAAAAACSDSELYSKLGQEPLVPDRIAFAGEICTEDTNGSRFPAKVLFVVDSSDDMITRSDPSSYRVSGPPGSIQAIVERNRNLQNVRFGFVNFASTARAVPQPDGQQFFRPQDPQVSGAYVALQSGGENRRDLLAAISQAESFITSDLARSSPGEVLRSRYLVYLLVAGPPEPNYPLEDLAERVEALRELVYSSGALEFQLNIGLIYYGQRTIDQGPNPFRCYAPGMAACNCGALIPGDLYCATSCDVQAQGATTLEDRMTLAREVYNALALVGNGRLQEFGCAAGIDLQLDIATGTVDLVVKDIVAFNANVRLTERGPVVDSDGDGLSDDEEKNTFGPTGAPLDHLSIDSDGDGLSDYVELRTAPSQDPFDATDRPRSCQAPVAGGMRDMDLDLMNDCEEGIIETSPSIPDSDGDGLTDYLEFLSGTLPSSADDRLLDFDADGVINGDEVVEHTAPRTNDVSLRGREGYRTSVKPVGMRQVPTMEDNDLLRAVVFVGAAPTVVGGQAYLRWDPVTQTLSWSDARYAGLPPFDPVPVVLDKGSGKYRLTAQSPNGEIIWIEVVVTMELLPDAEVAVYPLITVAERNCYEVRISNIKLMETESADPARRGINRIYVFFTQAPSDRLASPGIAQVTEVPVLFRCRNAGNPDSCARSPKVPAIELVTEQFVSAEP